MPNAICQTSPLHLLKNLHNLQSNFEICPASFMNDHLPFEATTHLQKLKFAFPKLKCNHVTLEEKHVFSISICD